MKLAIIGLDGATYRVIDEHRDELPTVDRLLSEGYHSELRSTLPATTSVAWPAFATGQNPARYGIFDFMNRNPASMNFYINDARSKHFNFFWEYMEEDIGLGSIPIIPYHHTNGFFVQGSLARVNQDQITYPVDLAEWLPDHYDYRINWRTDNQEIVENVIRRVGAREKFFAKAVSEFDHKMFFVMFNAIDHIQHHFWSLADQSHPLYEPTEYEETILRVYKRVDEALETIVGELDDDTNVVLASDHGFKQCHTEVNLNALLHEWELLEFDTSTADSAFVGLQKFGNTNLGKLLADLTPEIIKDSLRERTPTQDKIRNAIDWENTRAYSFGAMPNIYINLEGREQDGLVPQPEYDRLCDEIATKLRALRDGESDSPVFKTVSRSADLYEGPYLDQAPDIVVSTQEGYYCAGNVGRTVFDQKTNHMPNTGVHEREGILIASGPDIVGSDGRAEPNDIVDVAPTVLRLFGYDTPSRIDGKPIAGMLSSQEPGRPAVKTERQRVRNRILSMKQLGEI